MNNRVRVFWCEETDTAAVWLRRYRSSDVPCKVSGSYCNGMARIEDAPVVKDAQGYHRGQPMQDWSDPRWPTKCDKCEYVFADDDPHQMFTDTYLSRPDTGERWPRRDLPPGACFNAWWISDRRKDGPTGCGYCVGDDHRSLVVICPDGHGWYIDNRASNCTMKDDNTHHCWVRHGTPEDGTLHVDKNGVTCAAGAGSIDTGRWHGFLHNGELHT